MSSLRVAVVAEGPTDFIVIEAALKAILDRPFIAIALQPEATQPQVGQGWCGVLKWCRALTARGCNTPEDDVTLPGFDLFVLHIDADVADCQYGDCGPELATLVQGMPPLPCSQPCPPPDAACNQMRLRLLAWLGATAIGQRTAICVPSKAIDAWLAAASLPMGHALLTSLECNKNLSAQLANLPLQQRIKKKSRSEYLRHAPMVTSRWNLVRALCTQAARFEQEVASINP
jgi:hypothetical protein